MMTFAKLENGILKRCPRYGMSGGRMHTNLPRYYEKHPDRAFADGWLQLVLANKPDGVYWPSYTVDGNQVVESWMHIDEPDPEPTLEEINRADIDYLFMLNGIEPTEV